MRPVRIIEIKRVVITKAAKSFLREMSYEIACPGRHVKISSAR